MGTRSFDARRRRIESYLSTADRILEGRVLRHFAAAAPPDWLSIRRDRVPHPTLFARRVTECTPKVDIDDPVGALSK